MNATPRATIDIPSGDGHSVRGDLYVPGEGAARGIVVLCHGFKGYKDWGFFPYLSGAVRDAGFAALSIDFSHNGTFPDNGTEARSATDTTTLGTLYPRPDLFARNTLRREIEDVRRVVDHIAAGKLAAWVERTSPVGLFGHSRGGVAAVVTSIERSDIGALCTWSTTADPDFFTQEQKDKWRRHGSYDFVDAAGGTPLSIGIEYLDDLEGNHDAYHLAKRVAKLRVPHLIVHGTMDLVVRVESAHILHEGERRLDHKRLVILRTGHTFGLTADSPLDVTNVPQPLAEAVRETVVWFDAHLSEEGP